MVKLEDIFVQEQLSSLSKRMPWSPDRVYGKVVARVRSAMSALASEGKTALGENDLGLALRTGYSANSDGIECGLVMATKNGHRKREEFQVKTAGFSGLAKKWAWLALGEERFVERVAAAMVVKIARMEYRHRYEHGLGLMPGISAEKEAREIDASAGKAREDAGKPRPSSL